MIIPARWYSGGKGLDAFRDTMLKDRSVRKIVDFPEASDCFPGVQIKGGVCYFLWDRESSGDCIVQTSRKGIITSEMARPLLENGAATFIRYNEAISILKKVSAKKESSIHDQISSRRPFGLDSNFSAYKKTLSEDFPIKLHRFGEDGYVSEKQIEKGNEYIEKIKVLISKAGSGSDSFPHQILGEPLVTEKKSACTETYIILGTFASKDEADNLASYVRTRFFRFLVSLIKNTQNAAKGVYRFVPLQDFTEVWTDEKLYEKYKITKKEQAFIESIIRPL
jgi:site-specific DNA-methyltransferase (adenine-specific)